MKHTLQEHEDITSIPRAIAALRNRELHGTECLSDGELNHARVVARNGRSIALHLLVKFLCAHYCVGIVFEECFNLTVITSVDDDCEV